jgi:putative transposase
MQERGYAVDHSTIQRWVVYFAPRMEKAFRKNKKRSDMRWRLDETYIKIKGEWKYLYRAVDKQGHTIDFLLTARRDTKAARRFLNKAIGSKRQTELHQYRQKRSQYSRYQSVQLRGKQTRKDRAMQVSEQYCGARSSIHQTDNSSHARVQIVLVGTGDLGRDRTLAHAEEGSKQEFIASLGAVLRIGSNKIIVSGEYCLLELVKARDRTLRKTTRHISNMAPNSSFSLLLLSSIDSEVITDPLKQQSSDRGPFFLGLGVKTYQRASGSSPEVASPLRFYSLRGGGTGTAHLIQRFD